MTAAMTLTPNCGGTSRACNIATMGACTVRMPPSGEQTLSTLKFHLFMPPVTNLSRGVGGDTSCAANARVHAIRQRRTPRLPC